MFQEAASLAEADRWLRELRYKALENRQAESEQLKLLTTLLNDGLMPNQLRVAKVDSDGLRLVDRNVEACSKEPTTSGSFQYAPHDGR
jgi:hypothetical protein